ncbi:MAG: radical SAM protein [Bacteroidales bacterium]|nr:radical SAM protein [Lentimicrobiaceae bacterium]MDD5695163.1 radical SAM protein [Bacteroidales bacterium]
MEIDRKNMYRFPWSKTDNPGGWVEITDKCNMTCLGCYRSKLEGHRELGDIQQDILDTLRLTNCDSMTISGGEPLIYPRLTEVIRYMADLKIKPSLTTNGENLTPDFLHELKKAGLVSVRFHIDRFQKRTGWEGKSEEELNRLRQYYADMLYREGGIQCGFHVTVYRSNLDEIPVIAGWAMKNIHKVSHISFIAYRALPSDERLLFFADGRQIKAPLLFSETDNNNISITSEEMFGKISSKFPELRPCAYLNGSTKYETNKYLVAVNVGSKNMHYGIMGAKMIELTQVFFHLFKRKYYSFLRSSNAGKKLFLFSIIDKEIRRSFSNFLLGSLKNPMRLFQKIYIQNIHFQQPNEIIDGQANLCDDCCNMMTYKGKLINHCRLDEYRLYGCALQVVRMN